MEMLLMANCPGDCFQIKSNHNAALAMTGVNKGYSRD